MSSEQRKLLTFRASSLRLDQTWVVQSLRQFQLLLEIVQTLGRELLFVNDFHRKEIHWLVFDIAQEHLREVSLTDDNGGLIRVVETL